MTTFATPDDIAADWGELTLEQEERIPDWLETASDKLRLKGMAAGVDVDQLVAANELAAKGARVAVISAIRRRLTNPRGQQTFNQTDGPFTQGGTFSAANASGNIYIADEDIIGWLKKPKRGRIQSFTIRPGF